MTHRVINQRKDSKLANTAPLPASTNKGTLGDVNSQHNHIEDNRVRHQESGYTLARNRYPSLGVYETMPSKISKDTEFAVLDLNVRCIIG